MTEENVAQWMYDQVKTGKYFYQETAVYKIKSEFGEKFTYQNENGNLAISKKVLSVFKKISGDDVIWERGTRAWLMRRDHDNPGRQQEG